MSFILETERLKLRQLTVSDALSLFQLNRDPEVLRFTGDSPFLSVLEAEQFLATYSEYKINGYGRWAVLTKAKHEFVGWCGLKKHDEGFADLGFRFYRKEWGKGYATEAASACLEYGFQVLGLDSIIGRASTSNHASIRVLEKLDMKQWKTEQVIGIGDAQIFIAHSGM